MDRALTSRFDTLSPFRYRHRSSLTITRRFAPAIVCAKRSPIDGVSDELNLIASQNLDQAPARRRARSAFVDLQLQLDHCLFKVALILILIAKSKDNLPSNNLNLVTESSDWNQNRGGKQ